MKRVTFFVFALPVWGCFAQVVPTAFCCTSAFQSPSCVPRPETLEYDSETSSLFYVGQGFETFDTSLPGVSFSMSRALGDVWANVLATNSKSNSWFVNGLVWNVPTNLDWQWVRIGNLESDIIDFRARMPGCAIRGVWRGMGSPPSWDSICGQEVHYLATEVSAPLSTTILKVDLGFPTRELAVIAGVPSASQPAPVVVRTTIGPTSVGFVLEEPPCIASQNHIEHISGFLAIPNGVYTTSNGLLQAGQVVIPTDGSLADVKFPQTFPSDSEVVVVASLVSGGGWAKVRVAQVMAHMFRVHVEDDFGDSTTETISWLATVKGSGTFLGAQFEAGVALVGSEGQSISFSKKFAMTPILIASFLTSFETESAQLRATKVGPVDFSLYVDGNICLDAKPKDSQEEVGWIAIEPMRSGLTLTESVTQTPSATPTISSTYTPIPSLTQTPSPSASTSGTFVPLTLSTSSSLSLSSSATYTPLPSLTSTSSSSGTYTSTPSSSESYSPAPSLTTTPSATPSISATYSPSPAPSLLVRSARVPVPRP